MGRGKVIRYIHRIITKKDKTMKKLFKYTLSMVALCGALTSCSDETTGSGFENYNNGKELIALSGNDNGVTRAATQAGFSAPTKVEMHIKAEDITGANATPRYAEAIATAAAQTTEDGINLSRLSYVEGLERYWDDAFGRNSELTIYAFAIPGKNDAELPTWDKTGWKQVDENTNKNWYTGTEYNTVKWGVSTTQNDENMAAKDLTYSNNISLNGKGGRYTYKYENDAWVENKFGDGPLTWTPKTNNTGETTGRFDKGHLVFNHALAWIEINLKEGNGFNNNDNTDFVWTKDQKATSQNITLTGFNTEGTFDVAKGEWIKDNTLKSSLITQMDEKTGTTDKKTTRKLYAYVVPGTNLHETTANVVEFEIDNAKYYVTGKQIAEAIRSYYTTGEGSKDTEMAEKYKDFTTIELGKHYVINLSVAKKSIERITAAIVDWETVNSNDADAKNTYPEFSLDDRGDKLDNDDIAKFKLYRATKTAGDYITGQTEPNYDWKTGYSDKATKSWDAPNSVWKTDWFWENNLTYYHFRAVGDVDNASAEPTFSINTDADNGDYFVIKSGTLNGSGYKDYIWGAPFKENVDGDNNKLPFTYSTTNGFDGTDTNHQLSQAIGTTANDIKMLLFHMTSQITVNVKTTTDASKVTLKDGDETTKVEILNILPDGKVLMGNGLVSTTSTVRKESEMSTGSYTAESGTAGAKMEGFSFGIVPQPLTYSGGTIGLRITTPDGNQYIVKDLSTCTATVSANNLANPYTPATGNNYTINAWYPNYKYNYTVTIKKTGVERITAAVVGWETVTGDLGTIDLEN